MISMMLFSCGPSEAEKKAERDKADAHKVAQIAWRDLAYVDTMYVGDTVDYEFVFYNTGWKPVQIKEAVPDQAECSCRIPQGEILIGEQDTIKLQCIFTEAMRLGVNITIEHTTPQKPFNLILIAQIDEKDQD